MCKICLRLTGRIQEAPLKYHSDIFAIFFFALLFVKANLYSNSDIFAYFEHAPNIFL